MRELSFLVDLIVNHKLTKATKDVILERIKFLEWEPQPQPAHQSQVGVRIIPNSGQQAPSILAKYPDLANPVPSVPLSPEPIPIPVEHIAQNAVTAKALADRQALIAQSLSNKPEPGRTSPRKIGRQ